MFTLRFVAENRWEITDDREHIVFFGTIRECGDWLARQGKDPQRRSFAVFCRDVWQRMAMIPRTSSLLIWLSRFVARQVGKS